MGTLFQTRIGNELELLRELAALNPGLLCLEDPVIEREKARIRVQLTGTPGLLWNSGEVTVVSQHGVELFFPRFFPAVAIEARLSRPVFHPNVDPGNGVVCLWTRYSPDFTSLDALERVRQVVAWEAFNLHPVQVMNSLAVTWYENAARRFTLPLELPSLTLPDSARTFFPKMRHSSPSKLRLSTSKDVLDTLSLS